MDDEAARTEGVDGGTVYRYQQEIAQMVRVETDMRCLCRPKSTTPTPE